MSEVGRMRSLLNAMEDKPENPEWSNTQSKQELAHTSPYFLTEGHLERSGSGVGQKTVREKVSTMEKRIQDHQRRYSTDDTNKVVSNILID